ncbi:hypothetical protein ACJX0J_018875 [Zea mays]
MRAIKLFQALLLAVATGGYAQRGGTEVGDANTQYFHLLANGRHRKNRIFKLQDGNNVIEGDENLMRHITSYYKDLFGPPETSHITLDDSIRGDISQVSRMTKVLMINGVPGWTFTASSVLTSIALFMLSFFELINEEGILKIGARAKDFSVNSIVIMPVSFGGLNITNP